MSLISYDWLDIIVHLLNGGVPLCPCSGDGDADVGEPPFGPADVTMTVTSALLRELLTGQVSAFNAYMGGQLTVSGDLRAAMKLGGLVETIKSHK